MVRPCASSANSSSSYLRSPSWQRTWSTWAPKQSKSLANWTTAPTTTPSTCTRASWSWCLHTYKRTTRPFLTSRACSLHSRSQPSWLWSRTIVSSSVTIAAQRTSPKSPGWICLQCPSSLGKRACFSRAIVPCWTFMLSIATRVRWCAPRCMSTSSW